MSGRASRSTTRQWVMALRPFSLPVIFFRLTVPTVNVHRVPRLLRFSRVVVNQRLVAPIDRVPELGAEREMRAVGFRHDEHA